MTGLQTFAAKYAANPPTNESPNEDPEENGDEQLKVQAQQRQLKAVELEGKVTAHGPNDSGRWNRAAACNKSIQTRTRTRTRTRT